MEKEAEEPWPLAVHREVRIEPEPGRRAGGDVGTGDV